jgi:YbgC/YbaW family acyl-CoA thioester hydrolase
MATHEQAPAAHEPIVNESVPQEEEASAPVAVDIPVRFAETDAMGVVHHSAYIVWFEAGRIAWMAAAGMPYTEIAAAGRHFAVTAIHAEYRHAARFGDTVRVVTRLAKLRSRFVEFVYDVLNAGAWEQRARLRRPGWAHGKDPGCHRRAAARGRTGACDGLKALFGISYSSLWPNPSAYYDSR